MSGFACLLLAATIGANRPPANAPPTVGDVLFSVTENRKISFLYRVVLVGLPTHAGIVVRLPDGRLGVLEAGGGGELRTRTTPLDVRLARIGDRSLWIRRRSVALTTEQERKLNVFAALSENTGYSKVRAFDLAWFSLHGPRGPIRTFFDGEPQGIRADSVCSEIVVEALAYAGIIDSATARPSATTPRDLFLDRSPNLYIRRHPPLACGWFAPALWIPEPYALCRVKPQPKCGLLRFAR